MMRHSVQPRHLQKVMDFYLLLKIWGKKYGKNISKSFSGNYSQKTS